MQTIPNRRILLFSGDLDSYILYKLMENKDTPADILLYMHLGLPYNTHEQININNLDIDHSRLVINYDINLAKFELPNKIIPMRNLFLVMFAAYYGNEVYLATTKGDTTRDKDEGFRVHTNSILNHIFYPPDKSPYYNQNQNFELMYPVRIFTKADLVKMYVGLGWDEEFLYRTRSCYGEAGQTQS